jgi:hypothetical protein
MNRLYRKYPRPPRINSSKKPMPLPPTPPPPDPPPYPDLPKSILPIIPPTRPPPTPFRKLLPPPPDKGEDRENDPLPEGGGEGGSEGLVELLPNPPLLEPLLDPPKDLPPLLDRASARSERPMTTRTAKSEPRSVIRFKDEVLFDIMCLQYKKVKKIMNSIMFVI